MNVSLVQLAVNAGDVDANVSFILDCMDQASASGSDLLVLPELSTTGMNWDRNREFLQGSGVGLEPLIAHAAKRGIAFCGSFPERLDNNHCANTFYYFDAHGAEVARYRKTHLFSLFSEADHVFPGDSFLTVETAMATLGFSICYDLRFPELFRKCVLAGAEVQLLVAAFPHPRLSHWQSLLRARAIENQVYIVAVNQCGTERHGNSVGEVSYFGHSMVVDPWGEVILEAGEDPGLFQLELDLELVASVRAQMPVLKDRRTDLY